VGARGERGESVLVARGALQKKQITSLKSVGHRKREEGEGEPREKKKPRKRKGEPKFQRDGEVEEKKQEEHYKRAEITRAKKAEAGTRRP